MNRFLLIAAIAASALCASAQTSAFTPFGTAPGTESRLLSELDARYKQDVAGLKGEYKKYLAEIYKDRYEGVKETITSKEVLLDATAAAYLQSLVQTIVAANPGLRGTDLRVLFSRSPEMNACSMGEGTLLVNIGLMQRLKNESELAFAICHEMAHYFLDHSNIDIQRKVEVLYGKEFQEKLRAINKQEYGQNKQVESLVKGFTFRTRRHGREFEEAADSMALELLRKTSFDLNGALSSLAALDSSDLPRYRPAAIERQLSFPGFAFRKSWLDSDDFNFAVATAKQKDAEADSLKTHPDVAKRIERLKERVLRYNTGSRKANAVDEKQFRSLQQRFDYEIIQYCLDMKNVSEALFLTLNMLAEQPADAWLNATAGYCLNELYTRQKAHELGRVVELPSRYHQPDYNKVLQMIQNLRLSEIAALSYFFLKQNETALSAYEPFKKEWAIAQEHYRN